jgi:hypothetical protein
VSAVQGTRLSPDDAKVNTKNSPFFPRDQDDAARGVVGLTFVLLYAGAATAAGTKSCGTVRIDKGEKARLTIGVGSPACSEVRMIAKDYDHPTERKAYCHPADHLCEYAVYPRGWRCGELFQGNFGCWLGGDVRGRGARASFTGTLVYKPTSRALRGPAKGAMYEEGDQGRAGPGKRPPAVGQVCRPVRLRGRHDLRL